MKQNAKAIAGPMPYTPEWHSLRLYDPDRDRPVIFGASEAADCLGLSPYSAGPLEVYLRKRGQMSPVDETEAMEIGTLLEGPVLTLYERRTGLAVTREHPLYLHPTHSFMAATPDAIVADQPKAVDAKTTTFRRYDSTGESDRAFGEAGTDQLPIEYILQAQQQMAVLDLSSVDFPVLFDGRTLRIYTVDRNETIIAAITSAESELAERIANADPPEPNWEHSATRECLRELYPACEGLRIDLSEQGYSHWEAMQSAKESAREYEAIADRERNMLLAQIKDAESAVFPDGSRELRRVMIDELRYSQADVDAIQSRIGEVKRAAYERLSVRKIKKGK